MPFNLGANGMVSGDSINESSILCDMPITILDDGSVWARIFFHNNRSATKLFNESDDFANSAVIHDADRYSRLYLMGNFVANGKYELMIRQPDDGGGDKWRWSQTNNPITSTSAGTVTFISGTSRYTNGLMLFGGNQCFLAHTNNNTWFNGIGCSHSWGGGIPGIDQVAVTGRQELWVRIDQCDLVKANKAIIFNDGMVSTEFIEK